MNTRLSTATATTRYRLTLPPHIRLWRFEAEPEPRVNAVTTRMSPIRRLGPRHRPQRKR